MKSKAINRMTMRNATFLSIVLFLLTASAVNAQNYGFIHRDSILKSVPNYIPKLQELSADQKKYSAEVKQGMQDLQSKVSELLKPYKPNKQESIVGIKARVISFPISPLSMVIFER